MTIPLFSLTGKVAMVTGVSRGLGQAMAIGLAEAGAVVIGVSRNDPSMTQRAIESLGRNFYSVRADLSNLKNIQKVTDTALSFCHRVDVLVNNAGIIRRAPAADYRTEDWNDVLDVNLHAVYQLCQAIGKSMIELRAGKIINIASMLSFQGGIRVPAYTASKHAIVGLTKALANEWAEHGVCVNAIAPGYMVTDNTLEIRQDKARNDAITARIPARRWGTGNDLKGPVVFLASEASNYVNGHVLCVDGGWMSY